jgi:hypothetical protein
MDVPREPENKQVVDGLVNPSHVGDVLLALRRSGAERRSAPIGTWAVTVVFACLALGFMGSVIRSLSNKLGQEQNATNSSRTAEQFAAGMNEDMGRLMADPQTQLVRLSSGNQLAADASIAWNAQRQDGALFCDSLPVLPASQAYEIWAIDGSDKGAKVVEVRPEPGVSVYPFHYSESGGKLAKFELTAGKDRTAVLSGSVQ